MKAMRHPILSVFTFGALLSCGACNRPEVAPAEAPHTTTGASAAEETSDAGVTTSIQAKYYADSQVRGRNVSVTTEGGIVTLSGAVESESARQRAVALARDVQGVKEVRDELTVQSAATTESPDAGPAAATEGGATGTAKRDGAAVEPAWISTKIQAQYFLNPEIKPWNVDVTTASGGVVTLEGEVETAASRAEAVRIARETEAVTRVENRLRVKGEATTNANTSAIERPDLLVTAKIQSKYFLDDW